uniref:Uncharacterized protein n=1 Tax=Romanomermis culicivorax TaxID=13658 RepID=A0A915JCU0_ROMCU
MNSQTHHYNKFHDEARPGPIDSILYKYITYVGNYHDSLRAGMRLDVRTAEQQKKPTHCSLLNVVDKTGNAVVDATLCVNRSLTPNNLLISSPSAFLKLENKH